MSKRKRRKKNILKMLFSLAVKLFVVLFAVGIVVAAAVCIFTEPIDTSVLTMKMSSVIYYENEDGEKEILQNLYEDENRTWVDFQKIPLDMKNAFVAIEDERFFTHPGFDFRRLASAVLNTAVRVIDRNRPVYGGSTITQQLVKNLTGEKDRSAKRKLQEIYRAVRLENDMSKNDILELYLNTIYLSQNCNGVGAAAHVYFGKEVSELSLAECASIAGITQYPSRYDPYQNKEANKEKQLVVLGKMLELNMITEEEYEEASKEELKFRRGGGVADSVYSYYVDMVIEDVLSDLKNEHNYTELVAERLLYSGGLQIKCTIDPDIQETIENVYEDEANFVYSGGKLLQSSMIVLESSTGEIKAIAGGVGQKEGSRTLNRTNTLRQPGSSIKPIAVYAPALEYGAISGATVITDEETIFTLSDGTTWTPRNSGGTFAGPVSLKTAVARSLNIPAAKTLEMLGVNNSFRFLQNLGISSLVDSRKTQGGTVTDKGLAALSLGGLTDGVSVREMAGAYLPFSNNGIYIEPHCYTEVYDYNGELLFKKKFEKHRAMKTTTAAIMTNLMSGVVYGGTGSSAAFSGPELAGKTGTTSNNHDRWFAGYTPSYVGITWVGYDEPAPVYTVGNPATKFWRLVMSQIDHSGKARSFSNVLSYENVYAISLCTESGLLAAETCHEFETVYSVLVAKGSDVPTDYCTPEIHLPEEELFPEGEEGEELVPGLTPEDDETTAPEDTEEINPDTGSDENADTPEDTPEDVPEDVPVDEDESLPNAA